MANQQLVLVDVALKDLELHSACVDPSVNLREDLAILVHNAACRLADVCHPQIMDYQAVARQQLFEKLQVPKRLGSICRILLQHKQLRTLGGTLLGPLISLGTRTSPTARASNLDVLFSTQVAKSGLLGEIPGIVDTAVQKLEAGKAGTPIRVEVIVPNSLTRRRGGAGSHNNSSSSAASSSSGSGSASGVSGNCSNHQLNSIAAGQHEAAFLGLVSNLLQLVECLNTVWPGNLLQSPDTGPVFVPATQLVISCISYANCQLTQLAEKDQLPSASLFRVLYSAVRLCPTLCSVLARHGTRVGTTVQILPVASALMGAPSFRQCVLLYTALQAQIQMVAPKHGWLSTAETAYAQQSGRNSASSSSSRNGAGRSSKRRSSAAAAAAAAGSSSAGSSSGNRRRPQQGRSAAAPGIDAPIEGLALEAWRMACEPQQPVLLPAHEQLLERLGASRKLLLWLGMLICIDASQPSLQHAVLQQTLLVEVLDVYRSCWQLQPGMEPPGRLEVEQLQLLPCMLLQWANSLQMATDSEDYVFCAMGAAFSSRFALRTWMVHRFFHPVAVPAAPDQQLLGATAGQAAPPSPPPPPAAATVQQQQQQQQQQQEQEATAPEDDLPDDECFDELVPVAVQLMQRLLRQVQSGTQLVPSTTLAPMADPTSGPDGSTWGLPARTAAEALKQTLEVLNWVASTNPALTANWISNSPRICAVLEAFGRCESAGPARLRAQVLLGALRGQFVHDVVPRGNSSFLLSAVVLQRCMTAGVGSVEQTQLHSMLVTGLKLSSSLLPDQQFAYLELVSSISAAAQAVLCTLYEDAVAASKTDPAASAAAASAMLPWLFLLGRCAKYIAVLVEQLLQCKLDQEALWPGSNPARFAPAGGPGATRSLGLWLYITAGCLCMRLLHTTLTLLSSLAVDLPEGIQEGQGKGVNQGQVGEGLADRERRVEEQQKQQQQYLLQLSSCRSSRQQQQQQQQQSAPAQDAVQQGVDQAASATAAVDGCKEHAAQQQQLDGEQQQDQEGPLPPVQDSKHSEQQKQQQQAADDSAIISLRQMVWKAANDSGADVSAISEQLLSAYTAVTGADAALRRHFDQAVLMQLAQPAGEEGPMDPAAIRAANLFGHAPVMAVAAAPAAAVSNSSNGSSSSSSAAAGGPAVGAAASSSSSSSSGGGSKGSRGSGNVLQAVAEAGEVSPEACAAFAEDAAVVAMVLALHAASTALSTLPIILACNNPGCMNMDKESEQQMVNGRGCMCGGCKVARYCGKPCQNAHWKIHRPVCKAVVKMGAAEAAPAAAPVAAAAAGGAAAAPAAALAPTSALAS